MTTECDFHPSYKDSCGSSTESLEAPRIIQDELVWGLSYRQIKKKQKEVAIPTKTSPIDIPFKICREKDREKKRKRTASAADERRDERKDDRFCRPDPERKAEDGEEEEAKKKTEDQRSRKGKGKKGKAKKRPKKELTLLERSVLPQKQYMDYLAIPNARPAKKSSKKKCEKPCYLEPCPPRVVQLAVPRKRSVFANWQAYYNFLPTEMVIRFEKILHTDKNLEPKEARYYYKKLDKKKRKQLRLRRRLLKKKKAEKERGDQAWLNEQIALTVRAIMDFLIEEPLFALNYKQLMLSDGILERLDLCNIIKKPSRSTKCHFKRTVIEVSDKIAVWMDTLTRFVDIQAVDSDEDIPPLSISSLEEGEEEESEASSYMSEIEKGLWEEYGEGEGEDYGLGLKQMQLLEDLFGEGEGEDMEGFLGDLDLDLLEKLIKILSNCSDEYLQSEVNPERMPGVRYIDILNRIKELRDGILKKGPQKPFLEQLMLDWAIQNEPDEVDQKMKVKIHETAALLGDFLFGPGGFRGPGFGEGLGALYGMGEEGDLTGWGEGGEGGEDDEERRRREEAERLRREEEERRRREAEEAALSRLAGEGGDGETHLDLDLEKEEALYAGLGLGEGEGFDLDLEGKGEVSVLYDAKLLEGKIIKGHKPSVILEHRPDMVCCLSLKTWAVWLLEITHNAHNWTKWVHCIIQQIREFAAIVRGDVLLPNGQKKVLYKEDWRKFAKETEDKIVAWRQYSAHVKELSNNIIENFHGKKVLNCCPKCLQVRIYERLHTFISFY